MFYPLILPGRTDPEAAAATPFEAKLAENRNVIKNSCVAILCNSQ
tara:strand:+ start:1085 stop:1219 length:135 start_codon:yes stop_codon:yes gene_type:complete